MDQLFDGGKYLGKTYRRIVTAKGKEYGFSGDENGNSFLSGNLPAVDVIASNLCRYCLGGAGAYGPWNPAAMGVSFYYGGAMFGGYNFSLNIGFVGRRFGAWVTPSVSSGFYGGFSFSVFASEYVGNVPLSNKELFKSYTGASYNVNVGAGLNFGYGGDYSKDPKSGKVTLNSAWNIYSVGALSVGLEADWGYSIPLFNIGF